MRCNSKVKMFPNGDIKVRKTKFIYEIGGADNVYSDVHLYDSMHGMDYIPTRKAYLTEEYQLLKRQQKVRDNLIKTKEKIYDLANANEWNYFVTLTFSSEVCDRYSFDVTSKKIRKFMNNYKNRYDNCLKYLLVHECHKDGAYHYHGLLYLSNLDTLVDSKHKTKKGDKIYNWHSYKLGFSTVTDIKDFEAVKYYILKYIDKDIEKDYVKGQRRFYYSANLNKPTIESHFDYDVSNFDVVYESEYSLGYEFCQHKHIEKIVDYFGNIDILND